MGGPVAPPQKGGKKFVDDDGEGEYDDEYESEGSYDAEEHVRAGEVDVIKYQQQEDAEQESDEAEEIKTGGATAVDEDSI